MSNRLGGLQGTAYLGTNANQPPNMVFSENNPTQYDSFNVSVGDFWVNTSNQTVWCLVSLEGTTTSKGQLAFWTQLGQSSSELDTLTGNSGGAVSPDGANNINVVGDGTTITVAGNPGSSTLTASLIAGSSAITLTANSGGAVSPDGSGNINVVGDGTTIDIVGNPGTNTLTASVISPVSVTLTGNSGGAVGTDGGGNINVVGDGTTISITGNAGTNTLTASLVSGGAIDTLTGDSGGAVGPDGAGNINILGTSGVITVAGNPGAHSLTINAGAHVATSYATDAGSAVPAANVLTVAGGTNINTAGAGSTVTVNLDSTITGITNLTVDNLTVTTSETLSFATAGVVQSDSSGHLSSTKGTDGQVLISSTAGSPAWRTLTAGTNVTITNAANSITINASSGGGGTGLVLLATQDMTGLSFHGFTGGLITSTYRSYMIVADKLVIPALVGATNVYFILSTNNGATYPTGPTGYVSGVLYNAYNSTVLNNFNNSDAGLLAAYLPASAVSQYLSFTHYLYDLPNTHYAKLSSGSYALWNQTTLYQGQTSGVSRFGDPVGGATTINAFGIGTGSGFAFTSGTIELYGLTH